MNAKLHIPKFVVQPGSTPLLSGEILGTSCFIKDESFAGGNPTRTIKDRKIFRMLATRLNDGCSDGAFACITSFNIGMSARYWFEFFNLNFGTDFRSVIMCDSRFKHLLESSWTNVVPTRLREVVSQQALLKASSKLLEVEEAEIYDFSDGNDRLGILAYRNIAHEIYHQLRRAIYDGVVDPKTDLDDVALIVPTGCGDLTVGVSEGCKELGWNPAIVGSTLDEDNPIPSALELGDLTFTLPQIGLEHAANGLATPVTNLLPQLLEIFTSEKNELITISDKSIAGELANLGLSDSVEPTAGAAFCVSRLISDRYPLVVIVNSGAGRSMKSFAPLHNNQMVRKLIF